MTEIHPLSSNFLPFVAALEQTLFSDPWSEEALQSYASSPFSVGLVLLEDGVPAAYALYQCIAGEAELLRIGTEPTRHRKGFAASLMKHFEAEPKDPAPKSIFLEVRSQNRAAAALYEKMGFVPIGVRKGYYQKPSDDALLYQKNLN